MTRRQCRHENADHLMPGDRIEIYDADILILRGYAQCEQFRCIDCGTWLSLGPSNDVGCEAEIRAAELALRYSDETWRDGFVSLGMCSPEAEHAPLIERDIAEGRKTERDLADYYAGYLARCIATHSEDQ